MDSQLSSIKMKKMGMKLAMTRQNCGFSLEGLARETGIEPAILAEMERGSISPSLPQLENIALAFGRSVDDLVSDKSMEPKKKGLDASDLLKREKLYDRIIGLKIKKHRFDQHISIESLAQSSGSTTLEMEAFESGRAPIPFMTLLALCHELGISYNEFISSQSELPTSPSQPVKTTEQVPANGPVMDLPGNLVEFVSKPVNLPFVELAQKMSEMDAKKLRQIAESILEITL